MFSFQTDGFLKDNNNAAQRLLDGMNFMAQSVSELSLGPTKAVTSWLTDQIAPAYWRPNSQILVWWQDPWHSPFSLCCFTLPLACSARKAWSLCPSQMSFQSVGKGGTHLRQPVSSLSADFPCYFLSISLVVDFSSLSH